MKRLGIVIPAFDEEATVGAVVGQCLAAHPDAAVIVVSDGSADGTAARARAAGAEVIDLPCNLGVGPAVQTGLRRASALGCDVVARMDADGQHLASEISVLLRRMEATGVDFVSGSRFLPESSFEVGSTAARRFGNKALAVFLSVICQSPITDPSTGMWCVSKRLLRYFCFRYPGEYPEPEAMALLRRQGYSMTEAPIRVLPRQSGCSHVRAASLPYFAFRVGLALVADRVRPVDPRFSAKQP